MLVTVIVIKLCTFNITAEKTCSLPIFQLLSSYSDLIIRCIFLIHMKVMLCLKNKNFNLDCYNVRISTMVLWHHREQCVDA
jgi:surface polysaccharide O-acyltransferase-like enzyme